MVSKETGLQETDENESPRSGGCWIFFFKLLRIEGKSKSLGGLPFYVEANTDLSRCRVSGKAS